MCSGYTTAHYHVRAEANGVFSHEERHHNEFWLQWFTLKISRVSLLARDMLPATKACLCTFIWLSLAKVGSPTHSPLRWKRIWSLLPSRVNTVEMYCKEWERSVCKLSCVCDVFIRPMQIKALPHFSKEWKTSMCFDAIEGSRTNVFCFIHLMISCTVRTVHYIAFSLNFTRQFGYLFTFLKYVLKNKGLR